MKALWNRFLQDESGQGLVEYVLIIAVVALGVITALVLFRDEIGNLFKKSADTLNAQPDDPWAPPT